MSNWSIAGEGVPSAFQTLQAAVASEGEEINANWMSRLVLVQADENRYYVKVYASRGRGLRRWLGRSRLRAEWENLLLFRDLGVPTAEVVAFGETMTSTGYQGALVIREISGTRDLASLDRENHPVLEDRVWRAGAIRRLAAAVRTLHDHGFIHNDLKWRNILVEPEADPGVYIIDCPQGRRMPGPFMSRGRIKDMACLDKVAKHRISRSERLRFYLACKGRRRLQPSDKGEIRKILSFFSGRE